MGETGVGGGNVRCPLATAQGFIEKMVGVGDPAIRARQHHGGRLPGQLDARRPRRPVLTGEDRQHRRCADPRGARQGDRFLDAGGFLQDAPRDGVHRDATAVVVAGVVEDVEVQAETGAVHSDLAEHAELGEQLDADA
ncbi:hypothetical protein D3C78_1537310 [compost metagenome]